MNRILKKFLPIQDKESIIYFLVGFSLLFFSNGQWIIPIATWLSPIFLIRFFRKQSLGKDIVIGFLIFAIFTFFAWRRMIPVQGIFYFLVVVFFGFIFFLPYFIDRLLYKKNGSFLFTLVFPLSAVVIEYITSLLSPFGTWGSIAYTQFENLALIQIVSIAGLWGVTFLVFWFVSVVNWVWEQKFLLEKLKKGIIIYVTIMLLILSFGYARLSFLNPEVNTIRVASITTPVVGEFFPSEDCAKRFWRREKISLEELSKIKNNFYNRQGDFLNLAKKEANNGAKIVFSSEGDLVILKEDEKEFIERCGKLAKDEKIYLGIGVFLFNRGAEEMSEGKIGENKMLLFSPNGLLEYEYHKSEPLIGRETFLIDKGEGLLPNLDSPYGRISSTICFDMDFHRLIKQAGNNNVDLMLVPAGDWKAIAKLHSCMAAFRAVENGFSMVKHTNRGLSIAADYRGEILASMDFFRTEDRIMISHVPTKGVKTIYSITGDTFVWLCLFAFLFILFVRIKIKDAKR